MSFGDDQRMDIDADKQELLRNRKQESAWSVMPSIANSDHIGDSLTRKKTLSPLTPEMVQALYSEDLAIQLGAAEEISELLLDTPNRLMDEVIKSAIIKSGVVPRFVHFLEDSRYPELQLESVSVLTNIARGNSARGKIVIESGAVTVLGRLLSSPAENTEILPHACRALSSLCDGPNEQIQDVIDSGVCHHVVQLLSHTSIHVVKAALDLVGAIARGDDSQTQVLINASALPALGRLLLHMKESIVMKACQTLASIAAGTESHIQALFDGNIIPSLIELLGHGEALVRQQAVKAITNATANGSEEQILCIVEAGVIAPLCKLLSETDIDLTKMILSCFINILRTGESFTKTAGSTVNPFATLICDSPLMKPALYSEKTAIQLDATKRFGKLLETSEGFNLLIDEVIQSGTVPRFVSFLVDFRYPELQFESASVLATITYGNSAQTQVVIESGAVPPLIRLLSSQNAILVELSVLVLRNIAGDSTESRDLLLNSNLLPPLLGLFNANLSTSMMRTLAWTLLNLCRDTNPPPNFKQISQCLPVLSRLIFSQDADVLVHACFALAHLAEGPNEQIQGIINSGVCPRAIVQLLSHSSIDVVKAALRLVCSITGCDDSHVQVLIRANVLPALGYLLSHEMEIIVQYACNILANITAGNEQQVQVVLDGNLLPSLIGLLHHGDFYVRSQAAKAITNATSNGSDEQIVTIIEAGAIPPLCKLLSETDSDLIKIVLTGIENILRTGESFAKVTGSTVNPVEIFICISPEMKSILALSSESTANQLDATKRFGKILTNIASGNSAQTQIVMEQLVQALGNLVCDSTESHHLVPSDNLGNVLPPLLGQFNGNPLNVSMIRIATWTLSCLCFGNTRANFKPIPQCLSLLTRLMFNENAKVLAGACLALAYLGEGSDEQLQAIINSGVLPRAVQLLNHSSTDILKAALRLVFIIITGDDSQTQGLIKADVLPALGCLLLHEKESIVMEACCTLASITNSASEKQIQAVLDANLLPSLVMLLNHRDVKIGKSAAWAIANVTRNGSEEQIVAIVEAEAIPPLCKLLNYNDSDLNEDVLICIENILRTGKGMANSIENAYAILLKKCAGFDKISLLSSHDDLKIRDMASAIIKMCADSEKDDSSSMDSTCEPSISMNELDCLLTSDEDDN